MRSINKDSMGGAGLSLQRGKISGPTTAEQEESAHGPMKLVLPVLIVLLLVLLLLAALLVSAAAPERHLAIYSVAANYSLPIVQRQGRDYVGLLELLEPLGKVSARSDNRGWRLRYNNVE